MCYGLGFASGLLAVSWSFPETGTVDLLADLGHPYDVQLFLASLQGNVDIVNLLLSNGADVNAEVNDGMTAIRIAEQQGHREIVEALRSANGN